MAQSGARHGDLSLQTLAGNRRCAIFVLKGEGNFADRFDKSLSTGSLGCPFGPASAVRENVKLSRVEENPHTDFNIHKQTLDV